MTATAGLEHLLYCVPGWGLFPAVLWGRLRPLPGDQLFPPTRATAPFRRTSTGAHRHRSSAARLRSWRRGRRTSITRRKVPTLFLTRWRSYAPLCGIAGERQRFSKTFTKPLGALMETATWPTSAAFRRSRRWTAISTFTSAHYVGVGTLENPRICRSDPRKTPRSYCGPPPPAARR